MELGVGVEKNQDPGVGVRACSRKKLESRRQTREYDSKKTKALESKSVVGIDKTIIPESESGIGSLNIWNNGVESGVEVGRNNTTELEWGVKF